MSHGIEIRNGRAQMLFVGERPWHGLGTQMATPPASTEEALSVAGLAGWNVQLRQLFLGDGTPVDSYATVRNDGAVLGTGHKAGYNVVQTEQAFVPVSAFIRSRAADIETAGSLKGGSKVWLLLKINKPDAVIVPRADDRVAKYLLVATSFDGSIAVCFLLTGVRVVCQNTLSMALGRGSAALRIRHTASAHDSLALVSEAIERANNEFERVADMFRALAKVNVTSAQLRAYIDAVFPPAIKAATKAPAETLELDELITPIAAAGKADFAALLGRPAQLSIESDPAAEINYHAAAAEKATRRVQDAIVEIFETGGRGLDMPGVKGTAWAAYNSVTEYLTWERGRSSDNRMQQAWFGDVGKRALNAAADAFLKS